MTNAELIAELSKLPPDAPVVAPRGSEFYKLVEVKLRKGYQDSCGLYRKVEWPSDWNKTEVVELRFK